MRFKYKGHDYIITDDREHGYELHYYGTEGKYNLVERTDYVFSMYWQYQDESDWELQRNLDELQSMDLERQGLW